MLFGRRKKRRPVAARGLPPGMRAPRPRPGSPGQVGPLKPGQTPAAAPTDKYAQRLIKGPPRQKEKKTGNFIFRTIFFLGFLTTALVLGPNYELRGAATSFGLIGLMFIGVVLIDMVMWRCASCGRYMGFLPWPGQRCKKCRVRFF